MRDVPIGNFRERLVLLERNETADTQGGRAVTRSTLDTVPAEYLPIRAMERLQSQAIKSEVQERFRIRTRTDVVANLTAQWRPSW